MRTRSRFSAVQEVDQVQIFHLRPAPWARPETLATGTAVSAARLGRGHLAVRLGAGLDERGRRQVLEAAGEELDDHHQTSVLASLLDDPLLFGCREVDACGDGVAERLAVGAADLGIGLLAGRLG